MTTSDEIDTVLRAHAHQNPDVAEYLRLRLASQAALLEQTGPLDPHAVAWAQRALGIEDTPEPYRSHGEWIVERLTGSTPEASAYAEKVQTALDAALAWAQTVSDVDPVRLRAALHERAIMLRVMNSPYDSPAAALISVAVTAVQEDQNSGQPVSGPVDGAAVRAPGNR